MKVFEPINPPALGLPRGYTNGLLAPPGSRMLFIAGQTAADGNGHVLHASFEEQFASALHKTLLVLRDAGGRPEHVARMTVYVTDMNAYRRSRECLGRIWRDRMGGHYPAMALLAVTELVDPGATVEIEATAIIPV